MLVVRRPITALALASLLIHAAAVMLAYRQTGGVDGYAFASLDSREYYRLGANLARHGSFSVAEDPPREPDTWRTPGYPIFLAGWVLLVGESAAALIVVQQVFSILNVALFFSVARGRLGDRRALIAAALFLVEPYHVYYSLWLMATTWFITVLLLTWYAWEKVSRTGALRWVAALGVCCGYALLVRPVASLIPIVLFVGLAIVTVRRRHDRRDQPGEDRHAAATADQPTSVAGASTTPVRRGVPIMRLCTVLALFTGLCGLVVGAWMVRNHRVAGHLALSDQGGVVLAYFKATEVILWREGRAAERYVETSLNADKLDQPHTVWDGIDVRLRSRLASLPEHVREGLTWRNLAQGNRTEADSFAVSAALRDIGLAELTASPWSTAVCYLARCGSILTFPFPLALRPPHGIESRRFAWAVKSLPYCLLVILVAMRLVRRRVSLGGCYFPLACTVALLLASTPQVDPRFRVPMIPMLLLVALLPTWASSPTLCCAKNGAPASASVLASTD